MRRYRLVTSAHPSGAFAEFSAADDAAAISHAERHLYGARIADLAELTWQDGREVYRRVDL